MVFPNPQVEEEAYRRAKICSECPEFDEEGKQCVLPGTQPCCKQCGCPLNAKTRAPGSTCPLGKWGNESSTESDREFDGRGSETSGEDKNDQTEHPDQDRTGQS